MGVRIRINGRTEEVDSYSVVEATTPLKGGDTSGSVDDISFNTRYDATRIITDDRATVTIEDTHNGSLSGRIDTISPDRSDSSKTSYTAISDLGKFNVYMTVPAQVGKFSNVFKAYLDLVGISNNYTVSSEFADQQVTFPSFYGNVWTYMKQMAAAMNGEIAMVDETIMFRSIGQRIARADQEISATRSNGSSSLAKSVGVYYYQSHYDENYIAYPIENHWWSANSITVSAGGTATVTLDITSSLTIINQPVCVDVSSFSFSYRGPQSIYCVSSGDASISASDWTSHGGLVKVAQSPDSPSQLIVSVTGPRGLSGNDGNSYTSYSISTPSAENTSLKITGSGVFSDKQLITCPTGVDDTETDQDSGITIDNPFVNTAAEAWDMAFWTIGQYANRDIQWSGDLASINQRGKTGDIETMSWGEWNTQHSTQTWNALNASVGTQTWSEYYQTLVDARRNEMENQVFGNVMGGRYRDKELSRWFRIRSGTINPLGIANVTMDDDERFSEVFGAILEKFPNLTWAQLDKLCANYTWNQAALMGELLAQGEL